MEINGLTSINTKVVKSFYFQYILIYLRFLLCLSICLPLSLSLSLSLSGSLSLSLSLSFSLPPSLSLSLFFLSYLFPGICYHSILMSNKTQTPIRKKTKLNPFDALKHSNLYAHSYDNTHV